LSVSKFHKSQETEKIADVALSQALNLCKADTPSPRGIDFLRDWLRRPNMGNQFLNDVEQTIWEPSNDPDLISLSRHSREKDFFTKLIYGVLLDWHHRLWGNGAKVYRERRRREVLQSSDVY
jgi:hypothetical protein